MIKYILIPVFCIFVVTSGIYPQGGDRVIIVSNRVGVVIDKSEQIHYKIFERVSDFNSCVVHIDSLDGYYILFTLVDKNGKSKDTAISYSEQAILLLSEKIDHFEEILKGTYKPGTEKARIRILNGEEMIKSLDEIARTRDSLAVTLIKPAQPDILPFADIGDMQDYYFYPAWGFGFGVSTFSPDFGSVYEAMTAVENKYKALGYSIRPHNEDQFNMGFLNAHFNLKFTKTIGALINAAVSVNKSVDYGNIALLAEYYPELLSFGKFCAFGTAGISVTYLSVSQSYGDRISQVSSNNSYYLLDAIKVESSKTGFVAGLGISYMKRNFASTLSACYQFTSTSEASLYSSYNSSMYIKSKLSLSSLILGFRITFYL